MRILVRMKLCQCLVHWPRHNYTAKTQHGTLDSETHSTQHDTLDSEAHSTQHDTLDTVRHTRHSEAH